MGIVAVEPAKTAAQEQGVIHTVPKRELMEAAEAGVLHGGVLRCYRLLWEKLVAAVPV